MLPATASAHASEMNWLFGGLLVTSGMILALVFGLLRCSASATGGTVLPSAATGWARHGGWRSAGPRHLPAVPRALFLGRRSLYQPAPAAGRCERYPRRRQAMDVEAQHPGGQREIDELHVPVGQPVRLVMTSQDVIHSFFVPAFRIKQDVLPGRYTTIWFKADQAGRLPPVLRRVLRHRARPHGRHGHGDGAGGLRSAGSPPSGQGDDAGQQGGGAVPSARLLRLPRRRQRPCMRRRWRAVYGRPVQLADGRIGACGRALHPRFDPAARSARSSPATSRHAVLRRADRRGGSAEADRLHQVAAPEREGRCDIDGGDRSPTSRTAPGRRRPAT